MRIFKFTLESRTGEKEKIELRALGGNQGGSHAALLLPFGFRSLTHKRVF